MNSAPLLQMLSGTELPELGPGPRAGVRPLALLRGKLDEALATANLEEGQAELIRAIILLWHDHHDPAHAIAQDIETRDGSYIHAILHRREPDYFNAKYWFKRVNQHPCFTELASRATGMLQKSGNDSLAKKLMPDGLWDSSAFVDACEAASSPSAKSRDILREIQQAEFEILIGYLCR